MKVDVIIENYNNCMTAHYKDVEYPIVPRVGDDITLPVENEEDTKYVILYRVSRVKLSPHHNPCIVCKVSIE